MNKHSYNFEDLTGQVFNRWTVLKQATSRIKNRTSWVCRCICGTIRNVDANSLRKGTSKSCGCLRNETSKKNGTKRKTHGMSQTRFYTIWHMMKKRCLLISDKDYDNYGGRGIKVCRKWLKFENFYKDMYKSYLKHVEEFGEKNTSINRIDNNGNYTSINCEWSTVKKQSQNRRTSAKTENYDEHTYWKLRLIITLNKVIKRNSTISKLLNPYLGCTLQEFRHYIESLWTERMSWNNHGQGKGKWQIDHIVGCNNFDLSKEEDRKACFNYKNLRPMWYEDHIKKSVIRGEF